MDLADIVFAKPEKSIHQRQYQKMQEYYIRFVKVPQKSTFNWISVIRLPDFVTRADFEWAVDTATKKKKLNCSSAEFMTIEEGMCVQIMHIGTYDDEPATVAIMDAFLEKNGYINDFSDARLHHEI